jgi:5-methylcytosine-specific restriction protein A
MKGEFKMPNTQGFEKMLSACITKAENEGLGFVDINAGLLHTMVGGYPGRNHRMPLCCSVMRHYMTTKDTIIQSPPKGNGASLTIRYIVPR